MMKLHPLSFPRYYLVLAFFLSLYCFVLMGQIFGSKYGSMNAKKYYNKLFGLYFSSSLEPASLELEGFWRGLWLERRNLVHYFIRKWRWSILSWCKVFIGSRSECRNESTEMTFCQRAKIRFILLYCFFYFLLYGRIPQIHQAESPRFILQGPPD